MSVGDGVCIWLFAV